MVNRKEDQGEKSIAQIKEETDGKGQIEWRQCDLGSLKMVQEVFGGLAKDLDRLDYVSAELFLDFGVGEDGQDEWDGGDKGIGLISCWKCRRDGGLSWAQGGIFAVEEHCCGIGIGRPSCH